jgi:sodium transport system permease protein
VATVSTLVGVEIGHVSALRLDAAGATPVTLLLILPTALLTAAIVTALEMIACVFAKSFKESQTYLTPIFMAVLIPGGLLAVAPDLAHRESLYWVPFMNNTLLIRELLLNVVNPLHIASTLLTSLVGSLALLVVITLLFNREDVLFRT